MRKFVFPPLLALCFALGLMIGGNAFAAETRTFEGSVLDVGEDSVTLGLAGRTITVQGQPGEFADLERGMRVRVQAQPQLEAARVEPLRGSVMDRQIFGTVRGISGDTLHVQTLDGDMQQVKVEPEMARELTAGDGVSIRLKTVPDASPNWQVRNVEPMQ